MIGNLSPLCGTWTDRKCEWCGQEEEGYDGRNRCRNCGGEETEEHKRRRLEIQSLIYMTAAIAPFAFLRKYW